MGFASAMAWMLLLAVALVTAVLFWSQKQWVHYEEAADEPRCHQSRRARRRVGPAAYRIARLARRARCSSSPSSSTR